MRFGALCMCFGVLCVWFGVLYMCFGVLCMWFGVLCMYFGVLCVCFVALSNPRFFERVDFLCAVGEFLATAANMRLIGRPNLARATSVIFRRVDKNRVRYATYDFIAQAGCDDRLKDERLWEVQRILTQLKRLVSAQRCVNCLCHVIACTSSWFGAVVLNLFWPVDHLFYKIYPMDHFPFADTSWTTSPTCIAHKSVKVLSRICEDHNKSQVVQQDHVENHWFRAY